MYPGDWESLTKASSPLAAGLVEDEKRRKERDRDKEKRDRDREDRPCVDRRRSKESKESKDRDWNDRPLVDKVGSKDFEPNARSLAGLQEAKDGDDERGPRHSDKDSLLRQVKRLIVERVQHELSKVDGMIQERISRETQSLRLQMESLQRDVAWLRAQTDAETPTLEANQLHRALPLGKDGPVPAAEAGACHGPTYEDLMSVNNALKKARQGIEAQVSDLWTQIAMMQEGLEAAHLRHKLRFVATSMLALSAADLSQEEKDISKRALKEEEAALKERLQALAQRLPKNRPSREASGHYANGTSAASSSTPLDKLPKAFLCSDPQLASSP